MMGERGPENPARHGRPSVGSFLPPPAPLAMPDQCYRRDPGDPPTQVRDRLTVARLSILGVTLAAAALFAFDLHRVVSVPQMTLLQGVFLALSTIIFAWVSFGSATAIAGFIRLRRGLAADTLVLPDARPPRTRTALLVPIYHEDMAAVAAALDMMASDLTRAAAASAFDVFVLSDSRTPEAVRREAAAVRQIAGRHRHGPAIFFRRRIDNRGRKAGNIRDWIETHGGAYVHFIVLDADSLMSPDTLLRLVAAMEDHPAAGLIQTAPRLLPGDSLLSRLAVLTSALHGPVAAAGLAVWQRESGNYWGHNAIVRTEAFAASAGLPPLPGNPPFGGAVLSHDFVEAALMRRNGWQVHLAAGLAGTWEGTPPALGEVLARDRRWAQGNLQHVTLLRGAGLPWVSAAHLGCGAFAYLASALWAAVLVVGIVLAIQSQHLIPAYFGQEPSLFPNWPRFDPEAALPLFFWTMAVVFLPKILTLAAAAWDARDERGEPARLAAAGMIELVFSALLAPVLMAAQTRAVAEILARRDSGWSSQRRAGAGLPFGLALKAHWGKFAAGLTLLVVAWMVTPGLAAWVAPVAAGLVGAPVLDWVTSRPPSPHLARLIALPDPKIESIAADLALRTADWRAILAATAVDGENDA